MYAGKTKMLSWLMAFSCLLLLASADPKFITAESGQNVTLPCRAPNNNIIVVEWSRADLETEHVLLYRDEQFDPEAQHPAFKDRVDLQDRQMKDGDVSLILKNVTINDTGIYECRVKTRMNHRRKRALLKTDPIITIYLSVDPPPGPGGGSVVLIVSLSVAAVLLIGLLIYRNQKKKKQKKQNQDSNQPNAEQQPV